MAWLWILVLVSVPVYAQYVQTYRDFKVLNHAEEIITTYVESWNKEALFTMLATIKNNWWQYHDDEQANFMLYEVEKMLQKALWSVVARDGDDDESWSLEVQDLLRAKNPEKIWYESDEVTSITPAQDTVDTTDIGPQDDTDTPQPVLEESIPEAPEDEALVQEQENETVLVTTPPTPMQQLSKQAFYDTYAPFLLDSTPLHSRCFTYFDQIDAIAQSRDFPTWLIIATWHREHSCYFSNPDNWWWNFQITSHEYPPGDITREQFRHQIINFIDFAEAKWDRYDNIQVFGPEPVVLSYDMFDLSSLRKSAILYNGVYPDVQLDNSWYANENFTQSRWWRDGIVAAFLKVLQWELAHKE